MASIITGNGANASTDATVPSDGDNPYGGIVRAAFQQLLDNTVRNASDLAPVAADAHTHANSAALANVNDAGTGNLFLADDGTYKTPSTGGGHTIQDEGIALTQRANLNFVGAGVAVTDDSVNAATVVTISGSGGSSADPTGSIVAETILGSAAQTIDLSGFDLASISVEILAKGAVSGSGYLYVNGDYTNTNYHAQSVSGINGTGVTGEETAAPYAVWVLASYNATALVDIRVGDPYLHMISRQLLRVGADNYQSRLSVIEKKGGVSPTSITSIRVSHISAGGFAAGTRVRVINPHAASAAHSTSENPVGKWIDNKIIYRKVVDLGTLPNATTNAVAHGITGVDKWVRVIGVAQNATPVALSIPFAAPADTDCIGLTVDSTNVTVETGSDRTGYSGYAILEYTKT